MTDRRARAVVLTGIAFPAGAVLGAVFGAVSAPRNAQGFGDIVWVLVWFVITGTPLTMLTFWFTTNRMEWSWRQRKLAMFRMFQAVFLATGLLLGALWWAARGGNGLITFLVLPLCSLVVTLRARKLVQP